MLRISINGARGVLIFKVIFTGILGWLALSAVAFDYTESDLLMGFRNLGGSYEFVVNLGRATNFNAFAETHPGQSIPISTNYTPSQLSTAFPDLNQPVFWSCFGSAVTLGQTFPPTYAYWATRPRTDPGLKSASWN